MLGHRLTQHGMEYDHFSVRFALAYMQCAMAILKIHKVLREQNNLSIFKFDYDLFHIDFYKQAEVLNGRNNEYNNDHGVYLFIDKIHNQIICAGCTCTSFAQRHKEHTKGSKLDTEKSQESVLYCSYPHDDVQADNGFENSTEG